MKLATKKYVRVLDAQSKIYSKLSKLSCRGNNWRKEKELTEKLEIKNQEYEVKLNNLQPLITQEEFEEHLSDRMCLRWEEFKTV